MGNRVETTIAGHRYRFRRLRPDQVVQVGARLMPMFSAPVSRPVAKDVAGMMQIMGAVPPSDWDFVFATTFGRLERETAPDCWAAVWCADDATLAFGDIDLADMMQLVMEILTASAESSLGGMPFPASTVPLGAGKPN